MTLKSDKAYTVLNYHVIKIELNVFYSMSLILLYLMDKTFYMQHKNGHPSGTTGMYLYSCVCLLNFCFLHHLRSLVWPSFLVSAMCKVALTEIHSLLITLVALRVLCHHYWLTHFVYECSFCLGVLMPCNKSYGVKMTF